MKFMDVIKKFYYGVICQFVILILGFILPRVYIRIYGSDTNGLLSTISQIMVCLGMLEAGIAQATRNMLFDPIASNDRTKIFSIVETSQKYFRRAAKIYFCATIILAFIMPWLINSSISSVEIGMLIFFEGCSGVINYCFCEHIIVLMNADGKGYVANNTNMSLQILGFMLKYILACSQGNILFISLISIMITVCRCVFFIRYFDLHYGKVEGINVNSEIVLRDRMSYIYTELSWAVFTSTDLIIISIFLNTMHASVYSIYLLVFSNLSSLVSVIYNNTSYYLGKQWYSDWANYEDVHDGFTSLFLGIITTFVSVGYILCIPFVKLYMKNMYETEYINYALPLMFALIQMVSWSRYVAGNLVCLAGYARSASRISILEAALNLILSLILVKSFGMEGVLLATLLVLPIKAAWCLYISDKKILKRKMYKTIRILCANYMVFSLAIFIKANFVFHINSISRFLVAGIVLLALFFCVGLFLNCCANRSFLRWLLIEFKRKGSISESEK
ncbi:MAG: polysaccharide biosynthesis C-terminal domain-containing protein [Lachnospiraceae bacterium]